MRCQIAYSTMAPPNRAGVLAMSCPWHQHFSDQPADARGDFLLAPTGYVHSIENNDTITAQVKAGSRIYHCATLAHESTHLP